jgi:putative NIF3 family GTP cyclohydrolase 1 type 2
LYEDLERDFVTPAMGKEDWANDMAAFNDLVSNQFKKRSIGLVCDFTDKITRVRTAVFPSRSVMAAILAEGLTDAVLFLHHPAVWDIRRTPDVFFQMDRDLLEKFKAQRISVFAFHVPLDNYGKYSTSATLASALGVDVEKPFSPYGGGLCGVFGRSNLKTAQDLHIRYGEAVGHKTSLYRYGDEGILNGKVAVVAGGGNSVDVLQDLVGEGINTFVTGVSTKNEYSKAAHDFARENRINIFGGSHYSSEAFACKAMCQYFEDLGLASRFIADEPVLEDM